MLPLPIVRVEKVLVVLQLGGDAAERGDVDVEAPLLPAPRCERASASSGDQDARRSRSIAKPYPCKKAEAAELPEGRDIVADEDVGGGGDIDGKGLSAI